MSTVAIAWLCGLDFGFGPVLLWLTPLFTVAISRVDYAAAQFRARNLPRAFATIFALRQTFCFLGAAAIAYSRRDAATTVAAMTMANLAAAIAVGGALRVPGARLAAARGRDIVQFLVYAKPIVASMVIYALISLINRQVAFERLGAAETGEFSLAFDLSQRLFQAIYALPEILLFQYALQRDRQEGRAAAEAQIASNVVLSLAILLPAVAGYFAMGPTFEALVVPSAYRGEFGPIALALAPGLLCYGTLVVAVNPVFQLAGKTWPVTVAAVIALLTDLCLLAFTNANASVVLAGARLFAEPRRRRAGFDRRRLPAPGDAPESARPRDRGRRRRRDGRRRAAVQRAVVARRRRPGRDRGRRRDLRRDSARLRRRGPAQDVRRQAAQLPRTA